MTISTIYNANTQTALSREPDAYLQQLIANKDPRAALALIIQQDRLRVRQGGQPQSPGGMPPIAEQVSQQAALLKMQGERAQKGIAGIQQGMTQRQMPTTAQTPQPAQQPEPGIGGLSGGINFAGGGIVSFAEGKSVADADSFIERKPGETDAEFAARRQAAYDAFHSIPPGTGVMDKLRMLGATGKDAIKLIPQGVGRIMDMFATPDKQQPASLYDSAVAEEAKRQSAGIATLAPRPPKPPAPPPVAAAPTSTPPAAAAPARPPQGAGEAGMRAAVQGKMGATAADIMKEIAQATNDLKTVTDPASKAALVSHITTLLQDMAKAAPAAAPAASGGIASLGQQEQQFNKQQTEIAGRTPQTARSALTEGLGLRKQAGIPDDPYAGRTARMAQEAKDFEASTKGERESAIWRSMMAPNQPGGSNGLGALAQGGMDYDTKAKAATFAFQQAQRAYQDKIEDAQTAYKLGNVLEAQKLAAEAQKELNAAKTAALTARGGLAGQEMSGQASRDVANIGATSHIAGAKIGAAARSQEEKGAERKNLQVQLTSIDKELLKTDKILGPKAYEALKAQKDAVLKQLQALGGEGFSLAGENVGTPKATKRYNPATGLIEAI